MVMALKDELRALLRRQRPQYFIENIGCKVPAVEVVQPQKAPRRRSTKSKCKPLSAVAQQVLAKHTAHVSLHENFLDTLYLTHSKFYRYRQPLASKEVLETFIRQQLKNPVRLLSKIKKEQYTQRNFLAVWQFLHAVFHCLPLAIEHALLIHQKDQPRDLILKDNPAYVRFRPLIHRHMPMILDHCHRLYLVAALPCMLAQGSCEILLALDFLEKDSGELQLKQLCLYPFADAHQGILQGESLHALKPGKKQRYYKTREEQTVYEWWRKDSACGWGPREAQTRLIDASLQAYQEAQLSHEHGRWQLWVALESLWQLYALSETVSDWLAALEHLSPRASSVQRLQHWLHETFSVQAKELVYQVYELETDSIGMNEGLVTKAFVSMRKFVDASN
jgi:hypothetical protein